MSQTLGIKETQIDATKYESDECVKDCKKQGYRCGSYSGFTGLTCECRNTALLRLQLDEEDQQMVSLRALFILSPQPFELKLQSIFLRFSNLVLL